ncbi:MAG: hypothetical protein JRG84_04485 [Deltaproteobacteria bacterium]|nr:hypothetical protein [Deltaproteobacteria bacterium]
MQSANHVARLDESLLNGLTFLSFKQLDDGRWIVVDAYRRARALPSGEAGVQLRRRVARYWAGFLPMGLVAVWLLGAASYLGAALGVTAAIVAGVALRETSKLPDVDFQMSRREARYQQRGLFVAALAILLVLLGWVLGLATAPGASGSKPLLLGIASFLALICIGLGSFVTRGR